MCLKRAQDLILTGEAFLRRHNTWLKTDLSRRKHKQLTTKQDIVFNGIFFLG